MEKQPGVTVASLPTTTGTISPERENNKRLALFCENQGGGIQTESTIAWHGDKHENKNQSCSLGLHAYRRSKFYSGGSFSGLGMTALDNFSTTVYDMFVGTSP